MFEADLCIQVTAAALAAASVAPRSAADPCPAPPRAADPHAPPTQLGRASSTALLSGMHRSAPGLLSESASRCHRKQRTLQRTQ